MRDQAYKVAPQNSNSPGNLPTTFWGLSEHSARKAACTARTLASTTQARAGSPSHRDFRRVSEIIPGAEAQMKIYSARPPRCESGCAISWNLFADNTDGCNGRCRKIEGCPVASIPVGLGLGGFGGLLAVLETPLIYTDASPTHSLVRAAHSLSCDIVLRLARRRLCAIWDAEHLSTASTRPSTKLSLTPSSLSVDTAAVRTRPRRDVHHPLPAQVWHPGAPLQRVFYELLAGAEFWTALTAGCKQIRLTEHNLLRLYNARFALQQRFVLAPYMDAKDAKGASTCPGNGSACSIYNHRYSSRSQHWRTMMLESEAVEAGMGDPVRSLI
ncbi:hypothetical protein VTO73DRAFT_14535 [Trametes versicolor]